jgi:hypothetical protein
MRRLLRDLDALWTKKLGYEKFRKLVAFDFYSSATPTLKDLYSGCFRFARKSWIILLDTALANNGSRLTSITGIPNTLQ